MLNKNNMKFKPLKHIKIEPVAFDSFSVRSTCTYVKTDRKILIDPGVAIGPMRYGLPPSKQELTALKKSTNDIISYAKKSNILTVSHYHYDHYMADENIYTGKTLLIKDPHSFINKSQEKRGKDFLNFLDNKPDRIDFADGKTFTFGRTKLVFSPPVFHGAENSRLGYILMLAIKYGGETVIHASDVQGPQTDKATNWIIHQNPDVLLLSGFPTYLLGWRLSKMGLDKSNTNLIKIMRKTKIKIIVLDHHLVRDLHYKKKIGAILKTADSLGKKIITAAEFLREPEIFLEARRRQISKHIKTA